MADKEGALKEKEQGNAAYKSKNFTKVSIRGFLFLLNLVHFLCCKLHGVTQAIGHYEAAIALDPVEITFRSNLAAVYFEMKNFKEVGFLFLSCWLLLLIVQGCHWTQ